MGLSRYTHTQSERAQGGQRRGQRVRTWMGCMDAGEDGDGDGMYTSTRRDGREEMEAGAHVYTGVGCCGDRAWEAERGEEGGGGYVLY